MSYHEREIPRDSLERHLGVLDSDEGIRVETGTETIYINRTARRYCLDISCDGGDEFLYMMGPRQVLEFLSGRLGPSSRVFAY